MNRSLVRARITVGADDVVYVPAQRAVRNPVIYLHGGAATGTQAAGIGLPSVPAILDALAVHLFAVVAPTLPTEAWGNSAARTRVGEAIAWAEANMAASGPAVLVASSMGVAAALNYAADNPTDVAAVVGFIPAVDMQALRDANYGSARTGQDAAYSIVYPAAFPSVSDPAQRTVALADVPQQLWADTTTPDGASENVAAYASAVGADLHTPLTNAHTDASIAQVDAAAVVAFVESAAVA